MLVNLKHFIIESSILLMLLLPFFSFFVYLTTDIFFNFNNIYYVINIIVILVSCSYMGKLKEYEYNLIFLFATIIFLNLIASIYTQGTSGIVDVFRTISGYYMFFFWGWCFYKIYYLNNNLNKLYRIIISCSCWISIVNLFLFIWLQCDDFEVSGWTIRFNSFQKVADYITLLNKNFIDYIIISYNYDDVGFTRGVGYFFDTHSQYYLPLCSCIILLFDKSVVKNRVVPFCICLASILCSGIKTAYLTILLIGLYYFLSKGIIFKYLKKIILVLILIAFAFNKYLVTIFLGGGMWKILLQLIQHIVYLPMLYITSHPINFMFGGASNLRDNPIFYSEVFWVTVTFYIGIAGLIIYLIPLKLFKKKYRYNYTLIIPKYIYIVFFLSLTHYSVYMIGVNNIASAIPISFCFAVLSHKYYKVPFKETSLFRNFKQ